MKTAGKRARLPRSCPVATTQGRGLPPRRLTGVSGMPASARVRSFRASASHGPGRSSPIVGRRSRATCRGGSAETCDSHAKRGLGEAVLASRAGGWATLMCAGLRSWGQPLPAAPSTSADRPRPRSGARRATIGPHPTREMASARCGGAVDGEGELEVRSRRMSRSGCSHEPKFERMYRRVANGESGACKH